MQEALRPDDNLIATPGASLPVGLPDDACLMVGVTAHRDLCAEQLPAIEVAVTAFLRRVQALHPNLPVAVMSPLAEGGDRLVARCALAMGLPVLAPLPLPLADYEADCGSPESVAELHALLARSQRIDLPLVAGADAERVRQRSRDRDRQYAQLGIYLSSHCQVLLALWDGRPSEAGGGTGDVVHFHLHGDMPGMRVEDAPPNLLADDDSDLVYHVLCGRESDPPSARAAVETRWLTRSSTTPGGGPMPASYQRLFHQLGEFNADARTYATDIAAQTRSLLPEPEVAVCPAAVQRIDTLFRRADWLALHFRARVHHGMALQHVLAVVCGLLLMTYSEFVARPEIMAAMLGLFAMGATVSWLGHRRSWHRRYLDYRVLAEGLRVQCFWAIAGVPSDQHVRFAYDSFLQKQDVELGWIRHAMRAAGLGSSMPRSAVALAWVIERWVGSGGQRGQLGFFRRRMQEREAKYRLTERIGRASLWLSLAAATVLMLASDRLDPTTGKLLLVTAGVAALFAGVREAFAHKRADKELIKQYRFMARVFASAAERLARESDPARQRQVLEALGDAALEEHAEWILMHRERPLEQGRLG